MTKDYLRLETLIQKVVSPYLGTYGLYSSEGAFTHSCILGRGRLGVGGSGGPLALCTSARAGAQASQGSRAEPDVQPRQTCPEHPPAVLWAGPWAKGVGHVGALLQGLTSQVVLR